MAGITDLAVLLSSLSPALVGDEFVFLSRPGAEYGDGAELSPVACVREEEGLTLVVPRARADAAGETYQGAFRMITLQVNSSLEAVGLTAVVVRLLADRGISVNVMAAFFHDHLFVPSAHAQDAMAALSELATTPELQNQLTSRTGKAEPSDGN